MKNISIIIIFTLLSNFMNGQALYDYKVKDAFNEIERTKILDKLRSQLYKDYKQSFIFEVKKLNVCNNYAWFEGNVINKDGSEVIIKNVDYPIDCCHVEGLLQNKNGIWYIVEYNAFSTDLWFEGIWDRRKAPKKIYGLQTLYLNYKE
jgi:hypothetical protein